MYQRLLSGRTWPLFLVLALSLVACGKDDLPDPDPVPAEGEGVLGQWVSAGGYRRTYTLFVPGNPGDDPLPLLIVLHGAGGSGQGIRVSTGLDALAARHGFIVAYPDGVGGWATGLGTDADRAGVDDVGFIRTLITHLAAELSIDRRRVHVTGFSNGGTMSYRLGCTLTSELASITAVGAGVSVFEVLYGRPSEPLAAQMIGGTQDTIFPWEEVRDTARYWGRLNGCTTTETATLPDDPDDAIVVHRTILGDCDQDAEVRLYIIEGMGHTWPGLDASTAGFSANDTVFEFALQHSRPR